MNLNMLKFPPGFFGEEQLRIQDGRISRKKSKDSSRNDHQEIGSAFGGSLPRILEMPMVEKVDNNAIKDLKEYKTFK